MQSGGSEPFAELGGTTMEAFSAGLVSRSDILLQGNFSQCDARGAAFILSHDVHAVVASAGRSVGK